MSGAQRCRRVRSQKLVTDFRGPGEPDSGTAFEIGFAVAAGKPVWADTTDRGELRERVSSSLTDNGRLCEKGFLVEDFGLPKNLMIACSTRMVLAARKRVSPRWRQPT